MQSHPVELAAPSECTILGIPRSTLQSSLVDRKLHLRHPHPATRLACSACHARSGVHVIGNVIDLIVVVGGISALFLLAVLIGLGADREARSAAWRRIATARRIQRERERALRDLLSSGPCAGCPTHCYLRDLPDER
jgi:hypothetical protein